MKIGLIRFSSLGDVVLTTGVIREISRELENAEIVMITSKNYEDVFRDNPHVEKTLVLQKKSLSGFLRLVREVRRERLDVIADLHLNPRSLFLSVLSGSRRRLRYRKLHRDRVQMIGEKKRSPCSYVALRYFEPFRRLGLRYNELRPEMWVDRESEKKVQSLIENGSSSLIAIAPGANRMTKRWLPREFGSLCRLLAERRKARIVIVGDAKDADVADEVVGMAEGEVTNLAGRTTLSELAAVLQKSSLLVTNDSGPMHVASAVSTPVVALFGPTVPEFGFSPCGQKDRVVEVDLPCRPCSLHGTDRCREGDHRCMRMIRSEEVFGVVSDVLNGR